MSVLVIVCDFHVQASQCSELDVLIPLSFGSSKLLLVGDPAQLPATVKSRQAEKLGLGQSLFERLYKFFISSKGNTNTVCRYIIKLYYIVLPYPLNKKYRLYISLGFIRGGGDIPQTSEQIYFNMQHLRTLEATSEGLIFFISWGSLPYQYPPLCTIEVYYV